MYEFGAVDWIVVSVLTFVWLWSIATGLRHRRETRNLRKRTAHIPHGEHPTFLNSRALMPVEVWSVRSADGDNPTAVLSFWVHEDDAVREMIRLRELDPTSAWIAESWKLRPLDLVLFN